MYRKRICLFICMLYIYFDGNVTCNQDIHIFMFIFSHFLHVKLCSIYCIEQTFDTLTSRHASSIKNDSKLDCWLLLFSRDIPKHTQLLKSGRGKTVKRWSKRKDQMASKQSYIILIIKYPCICQEMHKDLISFLQHKSDWIRQCFIPDTCFS